MVKKIPVSILYIWIFSSVERFMKFFINIIFYYYVTFVSIFVVPKDVDIELQHGNVLNCAPNLSSASEWW